MRWGGEDRASPLLFWRSVDYEKTGRRLGTGLKVLGRMTKHRILDDAPAQSANPAPLNSASQKRETAPPPRASFPKAAGEGARRFGKAVAGPLVKTGHVLWLEVTGCLFALFALGFVAQAWRDRAGLHAGPEHRHFLAYVAFAIVFIYFCGSSFVRARRRNRR